ncbi:MAG: methyltransferase family protein [Candidatus Saccharibacteria bacterium]
MEGKFIVVFLFSVFIIAAVVPRIIQSQKKIETVGCIGIDKRLFFIGKISLFTSLILILVQLFWINLSIFETKTAYFWACVVLLGCGVVFFTLAIKELGTFSLRVGLAEDQTALRTTGIYRISRNPMLLGLYMMALGSAIYVQNPINWLLVMIALSIHHKIVLVEEVALQDRFGEQWAAYRNTVGRYIRID